MVDKHSRTRRSPDASGLRSTCCVRGSGLLREAILWMPPDELEIFEIDIVPAGNSIRSVGGLLLAQVQHSSEQSGLYCLKLMPRPQYEFVRVGVPARPYHSGAGRII